jgi:hypothetical protein
MCKGHPIVAQHIERPTAADDTDPILREALCPSCGASVQLYEEQLIYKRATCGACQSELELVPELFGRAFRVTALVPASVPVDTPSGAALPVADPPPSRHVAMRDDGAIVLRGTLRLPSLSPILWVGVAFIPLFVAALLGRYAANPLAWAVTILFCATLIWPWRVRIRVDGADLSISRGPLGLWRTRIPIQNVDEIRADPSRLRITRVSEYPFDFGERLRRDEADLR